MQNESFLDGVQSPTIQPSIGVTAPIPQGNGAFDVPPVPEPRTLPALETLPERQARKRWPLVALGAGILLALVGGTIVVLTTRSSNQVQSGEYNTVQLPLGDLTVSNTLGAQTDKSLKINGQLFVSGPLVIAPSSQPQGAVAGQLYYDNTSNQLSYYNGAQFVGVGVGQSSGGTASTTNTTNNITNLFAASGSGVQLQADTPGIQQSGGFSVSGTGQVGALQTSTISSASVLSATSAGDLSVATTAGTGITSNISIKTGDSSTTASGNITIDTGTGIIDGLVVSDKTFEGGIENMQPWFGSTIATTSAQAHSGAQSLEMTTTDTFWGVIEQLPGTPVTPGHQYYFSVWVRAATTPRSIAVRINWAGSGIKLPLNPVVDSNTGWTEMTGLGVAPAGATSAYLETQSTGAVGEIHYYDDITMTDLSSGSAVSLIDIGSTNAKIITIGNLNQIGPTTIRGGSGIDIQSGAAGINLNGGTLTLAGNASSSLTTSSGALTLSSAAAATWGITTATSGVGGDLTLQAGRGGTEADNDGGNLILQGGNPNGAGIAGGVIVRPQTDVTDTFQIQNSVSTALFTADTTGMIITIAGTDATYAKLTLADAHFSSTQTTPPTIGTPANCGAAPTAAVTAGSTDNAGSFTITTGTGGTSATCDTVITFNKPFGAAPKSIMVAPKGSPVSAARQVYVSAQTAATFTASFAVSAGGADSTAYQYSYWVVE